MSSPAVPNTWIKEVFATVAVPPVTVTAPPLMRIVPAASRLTTIVLLRLSSNTESRPAVGEKLAFIAIGSSFQGYDKRRFASDNSLEFRVFKYSAQTCAVA